VSDLSSLVLRLELQSSEPERNNLDVGRAGSAKKRGGGPVKIVALEGRSDPGVFLGTSPIKTHLRHHDFDSDEHTLTRDGGGPFP
jgi:hypothetical protein